MVHHALCCQFCCRYGTGFGIVGPMLGENSPLNLPNSIYGILFYLLTIILGEKTRNFYYFLSALILKKDFSRHYKIFQCSSYIFNCNFDLLGIFRRNSTASLLLLMTSWVACVGCIYLAYVLYFVLEDLCVVCITTYIINAFLLFLNHKNYFAATKEKKA